jgi:hypothetical protein
VSELSKKLSKIVAKYAFKVVDEKSLQDQLAESFSRNGLDIKREVPLSKSDRPDFECETPGGKLVIEVKVDGSTSRVESQLARYLSCPLVQEAVLITTKMRHTAVSREICNKPVHVIYIPSLK